MSITDRLNINSLSVAGRLRELAAIETWLVVFVPVLVLFGWQFNLEPLKRVVPTFVAMNPMTALCFIACGVSLLLLSTAIPDQRQRSLAAALTLGTLAAALLVLSHYIWHISLEPDRWLYASKLNVPGQQHNVMAPNTAFCFVLSSISLLIVNARIKYANRWLAQYLAVGVVFIAMFTLLGYVYSIRAFEAVQAFIPMAINTAFCFLLLGGAILLTWPRDGIIRLYSSERGGGYLLRRLVPVSVLVPSFFGWLRIEGVRAGLFSVEIGITLSVVFTMLVSLILVWVASTALDKKEREVDRAKDEFLSLATHQLQTPASGIMATLTMLRDGISGKLSQEQTEMVNDAIEANQREIRIVSDLLNVARADAGRMKLKKTPTDLGKLVRNIVAEQQPTIISRQQQINVTAPSVTVSVDADKLRMAIENLVSNASKYTPDGGELNVTLQAAEGMITITVMDNGLGVAKADIPKLFGKFTRLPSELSEKRGGTGLGLYLVKQIVDLHGGVIEVTSQPGKGSQFSIKLSKN